MSIWRRAIVGYRRYHPSCEDQVRAGGGNRPFLLAMRDSSFILDTRVGAAGRFAPGSVPDGMHGVDLRVGGKMFYRCAGDL